MVSGVLPQIIGLLELAIGTFSTSCLILYELNMREHIYTGLLIVGVLTTCHTQYTSDSSICVFLFNRTTLHVFVIYLTGALYMDPL